MHKRVDEKVKIERAGSDFTDTTVDSRDRFLNMCLQGTPEIHGSDEDGSQKTEGDQLDDIDVDKSGWGHDGEMGQFGEIGSDKGHLGASSGYLGAASGNLGRGSKVRVVFKETGTFFGELSAVDSVRLSSEVRKRRSLAKAPVQHNLALVIKGKWLDLILNGRKTWEIRGTSTHVRRVVRLAQSGTGHLVGEARVTNCFCIDREDLPNHTDKHCIQDVSIVTYRRIYAWVLQDAMRYPEPTPYKHPRGAITWVRLDAPEATTEDADDAGGQAEESLPLTDLFR